MSIFDLLLIFLVLATAVAVVAAVVFFVSRRWAAGGRLLAGAVAVWVLYLGVGTVMALQAPQHIVALGEDRCFDEMCFAVTGWNRVPSKNAGKSIYLVDVRITNRSGGRAQREKGRTGVLIDRSGRVYEVSREAMEALSPLSGPPLPGLDAEVGPDQSLKTRLVFEIPTDVDRPGFALASKLAINPARIVIGDEDHFLHRPTVVALD